MRLTFQNLYEICQDGAGQDTSSPSLAFFKRQINVRDTFVVSKMPNYLTEITRTFSTVADQQFYHYPPGIRSIESLKITIGSVDYPLEPIHSNQEWIELNAIDFDASALPLYYFKRQRDFGIYPTPQDAYTGTIEYSLRGGGMTKDDKEDGTVTVTENDQTVTLSGDTWSSSEVVADMWFSLADSSGNSRGDWYRIASRTDTTNLELESVFEGSSESGASYIIGESPEIPEEYQILPAWFAIGDYYSSFRQSPAKAQFWYNMAWTGDGNNSKRDGRDFSGGLLGLIRDYRDRNRSQLVKRNKILRPQDKVWATTIS